MKLILGDGFSKGRSMSDQPAPCPLCGAILRQSRNLRRHLELLHFGLGSNNKSGVHRRSSSLIRSSLAAVRPHLRPDHSRPPESSDLMTSLSVASTVSSASTASLAGTLMGPSSSLLGTNEQSGNSVATAMSSSCAGSANGLYLSDGSASMLSSLLPSLPSLSPHDVFRHGELLRAGIAYHDSSKQHRQIQRTDVT